MNTKLEINKLDKIVTKGWIGVPRTPGYWASEPKYKTVTCITMEGPLGFTGNNRGTMEILNQVTTKELQDKMAGNKLLTTTTFDGRTITLNLRYMVKAEDFTMVTREYLSNNTNFKTGIYTCRWLLPLHETVEWSNEFDNYDS